MELSKTYIASVDKYINSRRQGCLFSIDGMTVATNSISLIIFTPYGDEEQISPSDFQGINIENKFSSFKDSIWKHVIAPYWDDRTTSYNPMPTTMFIEEFKKDSNEVHKEYGVPVRTKLYDESVTNGILKCDVALNYGGMWINPELLYDVSKLISSKGRPVDIWIPKNKRQPAVVVGENKYGKHLGFVYGTMKNLKEN